MLQVLLLAMFMAAAAWALAVRRQTRVQSRVRAGVVSDGIILIAPPRSRPALPRLALASHPAVALALGILLVIGGQLKLADPAAPDAIVIPYVIGLGLFIGLEKAARPKAPETAPPAIAASPAWRPSGRDWWLLAGAVLCGAFVFDQMRLRQNAQGHGDVVILWLATIAALSIVAAQGAPFRIRDRLLAAVRAYWLDVAVAALLTVGALVARAMNLKYFPYAFGGDEGSQAMSGVAVLDGSLQNPFGAGWYSLPTMFFYMQAASIRLFGDSVAGVRTVSAVVGAMAVALTYVLVRRWFGRPTAVLAAAILAVFHYHVFFSRLASSQIADGTLLVAALYLLDRTFTSGNRLLAFGAGLVVGFSPYFYFGSRLIPLLALVYVVYFALHDRVTDRIEWAVERGRVLAVGPQTAWLVIGAATAFLPLGAYYLAHPTEFNSRVNQVSMFSSGWLAAAQAQTGHGATYLVLHQIQQAALLPFHTAPGGWYTGSPPFVGTPMALLIAVGLAIATGSLFWRRWFGLGVAYWTAILGLGLTEDPTQTQRLVIAAPLFAIFAALALTGSATILRQLLQVPRAVVAGVVTVLVAGALAWNVNFYFLRPNFERLYGAGNPMVATTLAYHLRELGGTPTVYFFGPPRMFYYGFQTLPFIARSAKGVDVERPLAPGAQPLGLSGTTTVFAFLPERLGELQIVRSWYPSGQPREFRDPSGGPLLTTYEVKQA